VAEYSYYEVLNVPNDATSEQIQSAYRALVQRVHPDGGGSAGVFDYVQRAYEVLSDPEVRRSYDAALRRGESPEDEMSRGDRVPRGTARYRDPYAGSAQQHDRASRRASRGESVERSALERHLTAFARRHPSLFLVIAGVLGIVVFDKSPVMDIVSGCVACAGAIGLTRRGSSARRR